MDPTEIPEFVEHELFGESWSSQDLENALDSLYSAGGGTFDPASVIQGHTDFGRFDADYGMADRVNAAPRPYADIFPLVAKNSVIAGLVGHFLRWAEKYDKSADRADVMLRCANLGPVDLPSIEEDNPDESEQELVPVEPLYV